MAGAGTQITVALIGVAGVVSAATIANYDKLFGGNPEPVAPVVQPSPAPTATASPAAVPPVEQTQALADAQKDVLAGSTAALENIASQIEAANAPAPASSPDISGSWRDAEGYSYAVEQNGDRYAYRVFLNGAQLSAGEGQLAATGAMMHRYDGATGVGECIGQVASDGGSIAGVCGDGVNSWPFQIMRG